MNKATMRFRVPVAAYLIVALIAASPGCSGMKPPRVEVDAPRAQSPVPRPSVDRSQLGTIGVVRASLLTLPEPFKRPVGKGAGAGRGAGKAGGGWMAGMGEGALDSGEPFFAALVVVLAIAVLPVVLIGGAIVGAVKGVPKEDIENIQSFMTEAIEKDRAREATVERIVEYATRQEMSGFVSLSSSPIAGPECRPAYASLCISGIDTILEVDVLPAASMDDRLNPSTQWVTTARARLVRARDNEEIISGTFQFNSGKRRFKEWANDNAKLLREEMEFAYQGLAEKIVREFFLVEG